MKHTVRWVHQKSGKKSYVIASDEHMDEFGLYEETDKGLQFLQKANNPLDFDGYIEKHSK